MEFGVFLPIANNGWIISKNSPKYMPTFALNSEITQIAERIGFDFALSMVKWRGFGGETRHWDFALESMTMMSAIAAVTKTIKLYGSVQPLTMNPAVFAKMAATIDDVSGGRFGVNIVSGWARQEYDQLGVWPGDDFYDYRYDYAQEWIDIVTGLWEHGRFTYHGKYLSVEDCFGYPQPKRRLPLVCAGQSDRGMEFSAKNVDANFISGREIETFRTLSAQTREVGRRFGREIKTFGLFAMIYGDTDADAIALQNHFNEGMDHGAREGQLKAAEPDKKGATAAMIRNARAASGPMNTPYLIGSADTIADKIMDLQTTTHIDGMLFTFPEFISGMNWFGEELMPRLKARGLRREMWGNLDRASAA